MNLYQVKCLNFAQPVYVMAKSVAAACEAVTSTTDIRLIALSRNTPTITAVAQVNTGGEACIYADQVQGDKVMSDQKIQPATDVGPGSAWQLEAEGTGRKLLSRQKIQPATDEEIESRFFEVEGMDCEHVTLEMSQRFFRRVKARIDADREKIAALEALNAEMLAVCKLALKSWFSGEVSEVHMECELRAIVSKAEAAR